MNEPLTVREAPASYQVVLDSLRVRPGYKQTEVGVIPEDWEVRKIRSVCTLINGRGFKPFEWQKAGLPIIRIQNINGSDDFNFYTGSYDKKLEIEPNQLLFAWSGSRGTSFGPHVWTGPLGLLNYHTWKVQVSESEIDRNFFYYALKQLTAFIEDQAHGASALVHTQKWEMEGFEFPLPPTIPEQRVIAAALSDVDALLAKLDQFIAKKRDLKQAAMQQLLTGQTRLPGFSGAWETVLLPDVSWFQEGPGVRTHQFRLSGVKLLNGTNISNGRLLLDSTIRYVSNEEAEGAYKHFLVDEGDILLATSGVTIDKLHEKVAIAQHEELPLCMNTSTVRFKVSNSRLIASYLYLFLRSDVFKKQIGRQATGSAQLNFGPSHLKKVDIPLPSSLSEQTAIATVLSDMDAELAALEARRDKTRALKQGMMQELLTGRIRLV
ncbi:MAG: hypothetical protein AUK53_04515 [Betaproteobacteria bacterium CG2_30_59_46]|nr:MAG: hypothetical protein AUK53_04515 [Betaproteobacteria bacterium CG2_30_59_46]PIQ13659.1 MAG: hypothetical protein COW70_03435 [Hydrogenophilales bacterium CG18_big_fil_WC_8_21_14_2_50_58_12]PIY01180.1 MAG: hypothetical protein COZ23_04530 [Hydrogenophilales bacterium CG_4_10_14_3_um_filter_58_23]PJB03548.1 MAG: hypothetical protein CO125_13235 [Hydrogenophilales bacterium CG_4_9_14_3_um_filter_59_35]